VGSGRRRLGDAGAGARRRAGFWTQLGVPVSYHLLLSLGVEHALPAWGAPPRWMGTLGVRQKVTLPIPFLRDGGAGR
jgi:hypothetical protein